jgi:fatty-acyl-CoA synthase
MMVPNWMNIAWCVQHWSELYPDKPAILYEEEEITYSDLVRRVERTVQWLRSLDIQKGDRVAVMVNNSPEFIELYLACSRLNAIFVPINVRLAGVELEYIIENSLPKLFIFGNRFAQDIAALDLSGLRQTLLLASIGKNSIPNVSLDYLTGTSAFEGAKSGNEDFDAFDPEDPQVIMYTSGTTGQPKGAVLPHRKTYFNCLNSGFYFDFNFKDIILIVLPLFHSGGLIIQASPSLYYGGTMILHAKFDPPQVYRDIERYRVTKFLGVPTVYRNLLKVDPDKKRDLSSLEACGIGGEQTPPDLIMECREGGFPMRQVMGQTETSIFLWASEEDFLRKPGTVGRPVFHGEVGLMDEGGNQTKPGEIGHLVVRGSIMMKGYWRDPNKNKENIKDGWLYTGDLARMDADGYFSLVDRAKDMYISGGENVYPAEVERVLKEHPGVEDVAVVGVPDEKWGEAGQAFIIPRSGWDLHSDDILNHCEGRLARYKWPKAVIFKKEFPRGPMGKVQKSRLVERTKKT